MLAHRLRALAERVDGGESVTLHTIQHEVLPLLSSATSILSFDMIHHICAFVFAPPTSFDNMSTNIRAQPQVMAFCGKVFFKLVKATWIPNRHDFRKTILVINSVLAILSLERTPTARYDYAVLFWIDDKVCHQCFVDCFEDIESCVRLSLKRSDELRVFNKITLHNHMMAHKWKLPFYPYGVNTSMVKVQLSTRSAVVRYVFDVPFGVYVRRAGLFVKQHHTPS